MSNLQQFLTFTYCLSLFLWTDTEYQVYSSLCLIILLLLQLECFGNASIPNFEFKIYGNFHKKYWNHFRKYYISANICLKRIIYFSCNIQTNNQFTNEIDFEICNGKFGKFTFQQNILQFLENFSECVFFWEVMV